MKKIFLVLLAMILPFLATDLHGATQSGNKKKRTNSTQTTRKKQKTASNVKRKSGTTRGATGAKRVGNSNTRSKRSAVGSDSGGAPNSMQSTAAEDRELALIKSEEDQVARNEANLAKRVAVLMKEMKTLNQKLDTINTENNSASEKLGEMDGKLDQITSEINEVNQSITLTCATNNGGQTALGLVGGDNFDDDQGMGMDDSTFDDGQGFDNGMGSMDDGFDPNSSY